MLKKLLLLVTMIFLTYESSQAIPAFARKYNLSCQTCHSPVPRLKTYGDEFAGNGFRFPDKKNPRYFVETGDQDLSLIRDFPIAARFDGHVTLNNANKEQFDYGVPYILKILSGGELSDKLSYYFYFYLSERGELVGVEDCYIMYNDLFGIDLDIYFGQFQVSDPLFKRELRLTLEDYQVYKYKPPHSHMNLAYDRGFMLTYGTDFGTTLVAEIVNGNGIGQANEDKLFDIDKSKLFIGRISQDIGEFLRIGGIFMQGNERNDYIKNNQNFELDNKVTAFGPDITINYDNLIELNCQYIIRKDNRKILNTVRNSEIETKGIMAELIYTPERDKSDWYAAAIANWIESDKDQLYDYEQYLYKSATLHFGYLLKRNFRLTLEGTYDLSKKNNEYGRFSIGFVSAF